MGTLYNFMRLINKYKSTFIAITLSEGYYNDMGEWENGKTETTALTGAIINHAESKIFRSEGALTEKDKRLFMLSPIDNKLHGAKVLYEGNAYSLSECIENAKFTGVYAYNLKYVSAFKDIAPEYDLTEDWEKLQQRLDGTLVEEVSPPPSEEETNDVESLEKRMDGVLVSGEL